MSKSNQNLGYNCQNADIGLHSISFSSAILDCQMIITVYNIADTTIKKFDPENMGLAARISFLSALELEKPLGLILPPQLQWR